MRKSAIMVLVVAALVVGVVLFASWARSRKDTHSIALIPGKSYEGIIEHRGTPPEPRVEWRIEGGPVKITILYGDEEIFTTEELQSSFSLKERAEGIYRFVVTAEKPEEIGYTVSYRYIGMAGTAMTVTKDIVLEERR